MLAALAVLAVVTVLVVLLGGLAVALLCGPLRKPQSFTIAAADDDDAAVLVVDVDHPEQTYELVDDRTLLAACLALALGGPCGDLNVN